MNIQKKKTIDINGRKVIITESQLVSNYVLLVLFVALSVVSIVCAILLPVFRPTFIPMAIVFWLLTVALWQAITTVI